MVSETLINCIITKSIASLWFLSLFACMLQARSKVVIKTQVDNNINVLSSGLVIYLPRCGCGFFRSSSLKKTKKVFTYLTILINILIRININLDFKGFVAFLIANYELIFHEGFLSFSYANIDATIKTRLLFHTEYRIKRHKSVFFFVNNDINLSMQGDGMNSINAQSM